MSRKVYIYALKSDALIVYVGRSVLPETRFKQHRSRGVIQFNGTEVLEVCSIADAAEAEVRWIKKLSPKHNKLTASNGAAPRPSAPTSPTTLRLGPAADLALAAAVSKTGIPAAELVRHAVSSFLDAHDTPAKILKAHLAYRQKLTSGGGK